jgi:uncharacterized membrane protein
MKRKARFLTYSAVIAALYAALTLGFQAISYGAVQFRVAEAMTLLPILFPEAVAGLTVGCLISNLFNPMGATVYDVVFGTLATFLAAVPVAMMGIPPQPCIGWVAPCATGCVPSPGSRRSCATATAPGT